MENTPSVTIALVDDHTMLRQAMGMRLGLLGYKIVLEAENGKVCLEKMARLSTPPDVCLLDINMPEMDGFETAIVLKKNWPQVKILFFSMHNSTAFISKATMLGADGFLSKDVSFDELKQTLLQVIKK